MHHSEQNVYISVQNGALCDIKQKQMHCGICELSQYLDT